MLFADTTTNEAAGMAMIGSTLIVTLITFVTTARRDRREAENAAILQWKELAANAIKARDVMEDERNRAMVRVAQLETELRLREKQ